MSFKPLNQKGFAAMEAILVVVILAIIGGTGYYVYHANSKATDTQDAAQTNVNTTTAHKTSYLTIKQWGVRLPLDSTILKDTSYKYFSQQPVNPGDVTEWVELSAPYTANVTLTCEGTAQKGSTQTIDRFSNFSDAKASTVLEGKGVKKVGKYYYAFSKKAGFGDCNISKSDVAKVDAYQSAALAAFYRLYQ